MKVSGSPSADGLGHQCKLAHAVGRLRRCAASHLCHGVDLLEAGVCQPVAQTAVRWNVDAHKGVRHLSQQYGNKVLRLFEVFCDYRANPAATAVGAEYGEGAHLTAALDSDRMLDDIKQIGEHCMTVQSGTGVSQFQHTRLVGLSQRPTFFSVGQRRGDWSLGQALTLLDPPKLDKTLADIKWRTGEGRIQDWRAD